MAPLTFKKSDKAPKDALQDFLRSYRCSPLEATMSQQSERQLPVTQVAITHKVGDPCYALYFGPRRDRDANWVPAIVVKRFGTRSVNVRVVPRGSVWRRHIDQLRPRYFRQMTQNLVILPCCPKVEKRNLPFQSSSRATLRQQPPTSQNVSPEYGPSHPQ